MARERQIKVTMIGDASSLSRAFGTASGAAGSLAGGLKTVAGIAGIGAISIAAKQAVGATIGLATGFEASMAKIVGLVGISRDQVNAWGEDIKKLAPEVAKSPQELADALFFITSAGLRGSDALDALDASARASSAGLGETKDVAFAAVSAMNAYGAENLSASQAVDILTNTVRQGNVEASEVAGVLGKIIPVASNLGVSFDQVGAAVASMTRLGADAGDSVTSLQGIFRAIIKPSKEAEDILSQYGLSALGLRHQLKDEGLLSTLGTLSGVFADNEEAATKVFGRIQGLTGYLSLMGANAETNVGIFKELADSTGIADEAFDAAAGTAQFQFNQALTELKGVALEVGQKLLPIITKDLKDILPALLDILPAIGEFFTQLIDIADTALPAINFGLKALSALTKAATLPLQLITGFFDQANYSAQEVTDSVELFRNALEKWQDPVEAGAQTLAQLAMQGDLNREAYIKLRDEMGLSTDQIIRLGARTKELVDEQGGGEAAAYQLADAWGELEDRKRGAADADRALLTHTLKTTEAIDDQTQATKPATEEIGNLAQQLINARDAQESLTAVLRAAADPVFKAVDSFTRYKDAQEKVNKLAKEGKQGTDEYAQAQLDLAKAALDAQDGLDQLTPDNLENAMGAIADALGVTKDKAADLLSQLGLLDNKKVTAVVQVRAPEFRYEQRGNDLVVVSKGTKKFARGGITGPNNKGLAMVGEGPSREAIIPLDARGIDFMAAAMAKAIAKAGGATQSGSQNSGGDKFYVYGANMTAYELADEIDFKRRTKGT